MNEGWRQLIEHLSKKTGVLRTVAIRKAFLTFDRADFVPEDYKVEAYEDYPLPIGFKQTISQPTTVAFMLELLDVRIGENVLDLGSGSGWTTALLSSLVGKNGHVTGVEIIPELVQYGRHNLAQYKIKNAEIVAARGGIGFPMSGPYDKILVSAAAKEVPKKLLTQLKPGGILVMPVGHTLLQIRKISEADFETREFSGFSFVELKEISHTHT